MFYSYGLDFGSVTEIQMSSFKSVTLSTNLSLVLAQSSLSLQWLSKFNFVHFKLLKLLHFTKEAKFQQCHYPVVVCYINGVLCGIAKNIYGEF